MKIKTHLYMANLLIDEIRKNNAVILPGIGSCPVPEDVKSAVLDFPAAFRAGAAGPDFYPDIFFGQTVIHPQDSGDWLTLLFREYGRLPDNYPEKRKCYAFTLGFAVHYAGDMYGHYYVNNWSKGWWEFSTDTEKIKIIARHFLIEGFMDHKVPDDMDISMDAPMEFLQDCFFNSSLRTQYSQTVPLMPIKAFFDLETSITATRNNNELAMLDAANYFPGWVSDIRSASREWLIAWQNVAAVFADDSRSVTDVKNILTGWFDRYFLIMIGVPNWAHSVMDMIDAILDSIDVLKPVKDMIKQILYDYLSAIIRVLTNRQVNNLDEALDILKAMITDPIFYLNNGVLYPEYDVAQSLHNEMGNYGKSGDALVQSYQAFYQCLNMGKLCLAGPYSLNGIVDKYSGNFVTVRIKTANNSIRQFGCGTDNDIYLALIADNGKVYESGLDNFFRNDFESGQIDSFIFPLPLGYRLSQTVQIRLRKDYKYISDDWKPEWIELYDITGRMVFSAFINKFIKGREELVIDIVIRPTDAEAGLFPAIRLKAHYGQYVCAENGGGGEVNANRTAAATWETFTVRDWNGERLMSGDSVSLCTYNGNYLRAEGGGGRDVTAESETSGDWERFIMENAAKSGPIRDSDRITLKCPNGMYLCAEGGGGRELSADRRNAAEWETFTIEFYDTYGQAPVQYREPSYARGVRHLKLEIHTSDSWFSGTDDNVYFSVWLNDGTSFETILDKPNYNDFERNDTDTYTFDLPQTVALNRIVRISFRKDYIAVSDDWKPGRIRLYDEGGNLIFQKDINQVMQGRKSLDIPVQIVLPDNKVSVDPSIISFLYSLDGKGHDSRNPTPELPWAPFPFYTCAPLRATVYRKLFDNPCTQNLTALRLKAHHGHYLCAENGGGREIVSNRPAGSIWETFTVRTAKQERLSSGDTIGLSAYYGQDLYAENGGGRRVLTDACDRDDWKKFVIQKIRGSGEIRTGDQVAVIGPGGQYLSAAGQDNAAPLLNGASPGVWEIFTVEVVNPVIPIPAMDTGSAYSALTQWAGFLYDPEQGIFYSKLHPWQENFGYFPIYDLASPLATIIIHCEPIYFTTDDGRDWKIELWKGQYGICTGAEIGIYVGPVQINTRYKTFNDRVNAFFDQYTNTACATNSGDMLQMSYVLRKNGTVVFTRNSDDPNTPDAEKHWWLTGFRPGMFSRAADLSMEIIITLKTDNMYAAFLAELHRMGYQDNREIIAQDPGNRTIQFLFGAPKSVQPWDI